MGDLSTSTKDGNTEKEEEVSSVADDEVPQASPAHVGIDILGGSERPRRRQVLHRVPQVLRQRNKHIYEPSIVSLGPYHHGRPHLREYEDFKAQVVNIILNSDGDAEDKGLLFRKKILERVDEIRSFFGELSTEMYDDEALVTMMVRDACCVLYFMETVEGKGNSCFNHAIQSIGQLGLRLMGDDYTMLENQIPWWIIKLLFSLVYGDDDKWEASVCQFLSFAAFWDDRRLKSFPWEEGTDDEPRHLLEARGMTILKKEMYSDSDQNPLKGRRHSSCFNWLRRGKSSESSSIEMLKRPFRSATELKAKGIHFRHSSEFLNDIGFTSHSFYGVLHLPVLLVDSEIPTLFSNLMVLEMSPGNMNLEYPVTSYVNFMKSLIESPKDVKMLQENGILVSFLMDNEQIVKMFNEIDTHGVDGGSEIDNIKRRIDEHCSSKAKTWTADLILSKFSTPWSAIAFLAAIFLLCLSFLQTYYTMNPRK